MEDNYGILKRQLADLEWKESYLLGQLRDTRVMLGWLKEKLEQKNNERHTFNEFIKEQGEEQ